MISERHQATSTNLRLILVAKLGQTLWVGFDPLDRGPILQFSDNPCGRPLPA